MRVWKQTMERAMHSREHWVVQKFVPISRMTVPVVNKRGVSIVIKKRNISPFIFNHCYAGSMARLSDASVINVSAGGGLIPVITYRRRT